ncbi:serine/threonine-protein kinase pim-3-like [Paramisgurnus dabryanus]|uniref:serine/threonine-protein kinase pim-3-like n=1 Tax=Paramisgurnus dabryanus TaxID=90735 RepID=UPI0031F3AB33
MKLDDPVPKETLYSKYQLLENKVIGRGGSGKVYKGIRKWDGTPVAIKRIYKRYNERTLTIPGYPDPLITEVALLLKLKDASFCPNVIELYDWYETRQFHNLVLQYPLQSVSLRRFVTRRRKLCENTARVLMHQAVLAVQHCLDNGVVHTDLHARNFLVQKSTMSLKLIDFGLGHLLKHKGYKSYEFRGAPCCTPPEIRTGGKIHAMPANVWALGALLYFMVLGSYPFPFNKFSLDNLKKKKDLSKEICDLLRWCLAMDPRDRPTLRQLLDHDWF